MTSLRFDPRGQRLFLHVVQNLASCQLSSEQSFTHPPRQHDVHQKPPKRTRRPSRACLHSALLPMATAGPTADHDRRRARLGVSCGGAEWGGSPESTTGGEWRFGGLVIGDASISIISSSTQRSPEMRVTLELESAKGLIVVC